MSYKKKAIYLTDDELRDIILEESLYTAEYGDDHPRYTLAMKKLIREAALRKLWDKEGEE